MDIRYASVSTVYFRYRNSLHHECKAWAVIIILSQCTLQQILLTDMIKKMIGLTYFSESGTTERAKEEATFMLFLDFLHECDGMTH